MTDEVIDKTADAGGQIVFESQEAVDQMIESRLARERKRFADYDDLKAKAAQFDALQAEGLSESDKLRQELERVQGELAQAETERVRSRVALELNIPADLQEFLTGSDEATIRESAERLSSHIGKVSAPVVERVERVPVRESQFVESANFAGKLFGGSNG